MGSEGQIGGGGWEGESGRRRERKASKPQLAFQERAVFWATVCPAGLALPLSLSPSLPLSLSPSLPLSLVSHPGFPSSLSVGFARSPSASVNINERMNTHARACTCALALSHAPCPVSVPLCFSRLHPWSLSGIEALGYPSWQQNALSVNADPSRCVHSLEDEVLDHEPLLPSSNS